MKYIINYDKYIAGDKHEEKNIETNFEDDYVVKSIGGFGRWQAMACITVSMTRLIAMWNILSILFLTPSTRFMCKEINDKTIVIKNSSCYSSCLEYEFFEEVFDKTLISEFSLICDRAWMASFTQTVLTFGLVIGISIVGWISDRFGRSKALILSATVDIIFMFSTSFATNYWTFTALRFFVGVASGGIMAITTVYTLEIVGPQYREIAGTISLIPDGLSQATLAAFAYLAPTWNFYLFEFSGISVVILVLMLFLPETPRWLVANGKVEQAVVVMTKAAKMNNYITTAIKDNVTKSIEELKLKENETQTANYFDLFKTRQLCMITLSSFIAWFVTGVCYFGINQYSTKVFGSNIFIVVAVLGAIQMPMAPLATLLTKVFGRKASTIGSFISIGLTMVILLFIPSGTWISTLIIIIGVSSTSLNFIVIYLYVTELYPTPIRNMGFSLSSSGSKLGAMVAPFVANANSRWISSVTFAVLPFIAAAICILLPETKGRKLRDTVDE